MPAGPEDTLKLTPDQLRWTCEPARFPFETTEDLIDCPIEVIGQRRAQEALRLGLSVRAEGYNVFVVGQVGSGRSTVTRRMMDAIDRGTEAPEDLVFVHDFNDPDRPTLLRFAAGKGRRFQEALCEVVESLERDLPQLFDSDEYRKQRSERVDVVSEANRARLREFEKRVQSDGFAMVQVQMGPLVRPQPIPIVEEEPIDFDQLDSMVDEGRFSRETFEELRKKAVEILEELGTLSKEIRDLDRDLRRDVADLDRQLARPLVEEAVGYVRALCAADGLREWLDAVVDDVLENLDEFRRQESPDPQQPPLPSPDRTRYRVNLLVDNGQTKGRPIIWESAPSYRNLFGTIEKARQPDGEWVTDHTRIRPGSLLRASGGFLVLDALDVLVEPSLWPALKRSLRHGNVSIQSFDPMFVMGGMAIKPEPIPVDVKVVMIGTRYLYSMLFSMDEDFTKIFKIKAELAIWTPLSDEELDNYACFVHKKTKDHGLPPFHRDAVAAVAEHAVRMAENRDKMTTRFAEIADVTREAGFWAQREEAESVRAEHVDQAIQQRADRVNMIEEMLRERIARGDVLIDVEGTKVGQLNGLAVLEQGSHRFGQPSRITATTSIGRAGVIDLEREASLSGSSHTKGILILTGFLRERFAQDRPLTLTASLCFEQNYGGVDGDSASSTELYALLSSLSGVPIRQGIAVTGSVNQRGEIQPIGGVNEKIEGYFDLCHVRGLTGEQGVLIPARNRPNLMLRKDVVDAVAQGSFHVWAVETIEQGIEVLTGVPAGKRSAEGTYAAETVFGRTDAELGRLAERIQDFGPEPR